jgi:hypothetical protein
MSSQTTQGGAVQLPTIADIARNLLNDGLVDTVPDAIRAAILLLAAADEVGRAGTERVSAAASLCPQVA